MKAVLLFRANLPTFVRSDRAGGQSGAIRTFSNQWDAKHERDSGCAVDHPRFVGPRVEDRRVGGVQHCAIPSAPNQWRLDRRATLPSTTARPALWNQ